MNLLHLRYFAELARTQHFTHAAERLCITQPSLSHAIRQLEAELGVPLFERAGRATTLTCFGEQFLACTQKTLTTLDEGVDELRRAARGEGLIRLGLLRTLGVDFVPGLAARFLQENPERDLRFTFHTGVTQELLDGLLEKRFDLLFCSQPPRALQLTAVPVGRQDVVLIVPLNHPLAEHHTVDLAATLPYPQVFFSKRSGMRAVVDGLFAQIGGTPQIAYETEEDQVIAGLVSQGFGISVVPYMEMLLRLDVKILSIRRPVLERNFYLVSNDNVYMPPAVQRFRQYVLHSSRLRPDAGFTE